MIIKSRNLSAAAQETLRLFPVPGMTAAVIHAGRISETCAFGVCDDRGTPMTEDTLFEAASLTKSLFSVLVMRLCDRGVISLDTPIAAQLSDLPWSNDPRYSAITPRMALSHASGLPNWAARPLQMLFTPGTSYSYSGEGYYLLQHLAEQKTGKSLPELFQTEFFTPWDMDAFGVFTPEVGARMSCGFGADGKLIKRRTEPDLTGNAPEPNSAWSLYANAKLYAQFLCQMILNRGGLSEHSFSKMTARQNDAGGDILWGLGWGIPARSQSTLWHWGDNTGFKSFAVWDKDTGDGLTVFTNTDAGLPCYMELCRRMTNGRFFEAIETFIAHAE